MNGLGFVASLIASLSWPAVAAGAIILFRKPLAELLGRIKSYEGLGQKVTFGERLAEAEASVEEVARSVEIDHPEAEKEIAVESSPLAREAEANPSYVILQAWEFILDTLTALDHEITGQLHARGMDRVLLDLQRRGGGGVGPEFFRAFAELRDLRNRVAHGRHNPTPGEAVTYAQSVQVLARVARRAAQLIEQNDASPIP